MAARHALMGLVGLVLAWAGTVQAEDRAAAARAAVEREIGTPECSSHAQCRSLAMGSRPCGGAEFYLPYSTLRSNPARLEELAAVHRAERKAAHAASGRMGTCRVLPDPGVQCAPSTRLCTLGAVAD